MDPQVTLHEIVTSLSQGQRDDAATHLEDLAQWIRKGGYLPTVMARPGTPADWIIPPHSLVKDGRFV